MTKVHVPAYIDSFAGLVPCLVTKLAGDGSRVERVVIKVTSKKFGKAGYWYGDKTDFACHRVVPRAAIKRTKYSTIIKPYTWADYYPKQEA